MKKYFFISLAVLSLTACVNKEDDDCPSQQTDRLIRAVASMPQITTRAPIESDLTAKLPQNDLAIYFARASDAATADWTTVTKPQTTDEGFGPGILKGSLVGLHDNTNKGKINFEESQYFNSDETLKSWFVSYYPKVDGGEEDDLPTAATLMWTLDGKKDVMYSPAVSGDKVANASTPLAFVLNHKLAWLVFQVRTDGVPDSDGDVIAAKEAWGNITSIKIKGTSNLYKLVLPDTPSFSGSVDMNTWNASDAAPASQALNVTATFFSQALVQAMPYATDRNYTLLITTSKHATPVELPIALTGNVSAVAGKKHTITLIFKATGITATGQITPWTDGTPGSATII